MWAVGPNPGRINAVHRHNSREYGKATRDLFAPAIDVRARLPGDETADGCFDNFADILSVSMSRLERHMIVPKIALGLGLRHDWGALSIRPISSRASSGGPGIRAMAAYVGEPECKGVAERFMRTLKEECLYFHDFESLEEARRDIGAFIERYNRGWLLERHGYRTPSQVREELTFMAG